MHISDWSSDVCSSDLCGGGQTAPASRSRSGISQRYGNDIVSDHNDLLEETGAPRSEARHARVQVTIERALGGDAMGLILLISSDNVGVRHATAASFTFTEQFSVFLLLLSTFFGTTCAFLTNENLINTK